MNNQLDLLKDILSERLQGWLSNLSDIHEALVEASDTKPHSFVHLLACELSDFFEEE